MAVQKSDQITNITAIPPVKTRTSEMGGRVRVAYFSFTTPAGGVAIADTVQLCVIPKGARILGGEAKFEAMSTGAGAATVELGDGTTAAKYLAATSVDAAGKAAFADTVALNYGELLTSELTLTATASVEAWAAAKKLYGHVLYALD